MLFCEALESLKMNLIRRVRNGELTERGLARRLGISQAHMHNLLKGVRTLTPELADKILVEFHVSIEDLVNAETPRQPPGRALHPEAAVRARSRATSK